ncbi:MAG: hypothetical protein V1742_00065, partial [Pseudomonadota bacterium]
MPESRLSTTMRLAEQARGGDVKALKALCEHLSVPFYDRLPPPKLPPGLDSRLDVGWARKNRLVPFAAEEDYVLVATPWPTAPGPMDELAYALGRRVKVVG